MKMSQSALGFPPPVIETERLRLRGHRVDDYAASAAMWADPAVVRYISGTPSSAQRSWLRVLEYVGHWALLGFGYWVIEERSTNAFAGEIGFADFKRDIDSSLRSIPEAGWVLAPAMHGRGYATEALRAILAWADARAWPQTIAIVAPENAASIRVAEKCGFAVARRIEFVGSPTIVYARPHARFG